MLSRIGFDDFKFEKFSNNLESKIPLAKSIGLSKAEGALKSLSKFGFNFLPNIVCYAKKSRNESEYSSTITKILEKSMVGREVKILEVWLSDLKDKKI